MLWHVVGEAEEENFPEENGKRKVGVGLGQRDRSRAVSQATILVGDSAHPYRSNSASRSAVGRLRWQHLGALIVRAPRAQTAQRHRSLCVHATHRALWHANWCSLLKRQLSCPNL